MSGAHDNAVDAMNRLLDELPFEFSNDDPEFNPCQRREFRVIKQRNVRAVHEALWELQIHLGMQED